MRHFVSLDEFSRPELEQLLEDAQRRTTTPWSTQPRTLSHVSIASLFFEASTRTRISFELAAQRLGANLVNVNPDLSSTLKGETIWDTVATLQAMGIDQFIVRTPEVGLPAMLAAKVNDNVSIINAGEAHLSHPSQGLLDLLTLRQYKGDLASLSIAIVGDIAHSRVARSFHQGAIILGCKDIRLVAPSMWQGAQEDFAGAQLTDDLDQALIGVDVIMALRIQKERMRYSAKQNIDDYRRRFSINEERLKSAKPDILVMHPGPFNRNVEITDAVADGPHSVIQKQVAIGVPARMAIISALAAHGNENTHGT